MSKHKGRPTHGLFNDNRELYMKWNAMVDRCYRPSNIAYPKYGAKGITVCDDWRTFAPFATWAFANGWKAGCDLSVDRIDNAKGYYPANCRIATRSQQALNRKQGASSACGFPGVERMNSGWRAYIKINQRKKHLGVFASREEAAAARSAALSERSVEQQSR